MPFSYLLTNLLVDVPQAVGAIFVDPEGEAVEWVTRHDDPFDRFWRKSSLAKC